ncbi:hypothetical protein Goari_014815 [Gossypium aridum]|uniref:(+)-delta-cadinene synthase n=1 Tax=Gossypium aridum TaxID=34290 RepID=A0A7J8XIZ0_GOSAI|nr:hypothetical protein [Gossypium aridum]
MEDALQIIYHCHCNHIHDGDDLYTTAVRFRLLREHGFNVDCDEKGNFKESLNGDVKGMVELFEAAHLQLHGENILEEARSFTTFHLKLAESGSDINCIDQLPDYMKLWYSKALKVYKDMEDLMSKEGKPYRVQYAIEALAIASFVGMEDGITKETFNWAVNEPKIIRASNIICRLMSDIAGHKVEQERGHVSSAVECYLKQYGFLKPTAAPTSALIRVLNLSKVIDLLYQGEDAYTQVVDSAKTSITALLIDSIPI